MNKQELLDVMYGHRACDEATEYVREHSSDDAAVIGGECDRSDWLIWLLGRERRLSGFVCGCAARAVRHAYAAYAADAAYAAYAAADAAYAARHAADAAFAAAAAAADTADERKTQLVDLQQLFRDWANGLPEEV